MNIVYPISNFVFNKDLKLLFSEENSLIPINSIKIFPNKGKQFFIINEKTNNYRRFRLNNQNENIFLFESEDNILCIVEKKDILEDYLLSSLY